MSGLRALRSSPLYPPPPSPSESTKEGATGTPSVEKEKEKHSASEAGSHGSEHERPLVRHRESGIEELASTVSTLSHPQQQQQEKEPRPSPLADVTPLVESLRNLSDGLRATSTTRESLLSTLEGYTSVLHRQVYLRSTNSSGIGGLGGNFGMGDSSKSKSIGLSTLSSNLAEAQGTHTGEIDMSRRGQEWDAVRKEIRAIKGMLLGRRNFAPIS